MLTLKSVSANAFLGGYCYYLIETINPSPWGVGFYLLLCHVYIAIKIKYVERNYINGFPVGTFEHNTGFCYTLCI